MSGLSEDAGDVLVKKDMTEGRICPNEVLQYLFSFMKWADLKSAREVCQSWNKNALPLLQPRNKCVLKMKNSEDWFDFMSTMKNAPELPFVSTELEIRSPARYDKIQEFFVLFGSSIKSLTILFECCGKNEDYKFSLAYNDLLSILTSCKHLTDLYLTVEYNANVQEKFVERYSDSSGGNQFSTIKTLSFVELSSTEHSDFCISAKFLPALVKWMPNVTDVEAKFCTNSQFNQFFNLLERCRKIGHLNLIRCLRLENHSDVIYFSQYHLTALIELKFSLSKLALNFFLFAGCSAVNREDISLESLYDFLSSNDSLKHLELYSFDVATTLPIINNPTSKFPSMKNIVQLDLDFLVCSINVLPHKDLTLHFPMLKVCNISTGWEPRLAKAFPYIEFNKWSDFWFKIKKNKETEKESRKVIFKHDTFDCYFQKPNFFNLLFNNWFPGIQVFSANVGVHFGLLNLLRGLCSTTVQDLLIKVDCEVCKYHATHESYDKSQENDYQSVFKYGLQQDLTNLPFSELKSLKITTFGCSQIGIQYLHANNVLVLLDAAPKLSSFTIITNLNEYSGKTVSTYQK